MEAVTQHETLTAAQLAHERRASIEESLRALRTAGIRIPQPDKVRGYLRQHGDMLALVRRACTIALEHVGGEAQLSLELYIDPEIDDRYLALYVRYEQYSDTTMDKIDEICRIYEQDLLGKSGWFITTTDFGRPE
jgi:hypothetical protein